MSVFSNNSSTNVENTCRACLGTNIDVRPMSIDEIKWYQTFTAKSLCMDQKSYICPLCGYLFGKFKRFAEQCQKADYMFDEALQELKSLTILPSHHFTISPPKVYYLGPPDADLDIDDIDNADYDVTIEYTNSEDDELPLVMLRKGDEGRIRQKKSRNDWIEETDPNTTEIDADLKPEPDNCLNEHVDKKTRRKALKEGFSSRMVQETDEYLVIKLTKEQVLEEMQARLTSDKYQRALYKCEQCVKGFNFEDVLRGHKEKHTKENGELQCDICKQYCPSAVSLRGHMKSHTTRYKCKVCGDVRLSRQHLLEHHAISHTAEATEYTCEHCYFTTNKRTVIQRHVKTHKRSERHACHECGRLFQNIESLRVHTARHDKSKSLQCEYCSRKFIYPSLLQKHVQSVHLQRDYYCVECDVRFKSPDNLRLHFKKAKKHRDSSSYTHACPQCEEKFVTAPSLSVHMTTVHGQPKGHSCALCRRLYSSRESLKGHVRRVHAERQAAGHSCHVCKKSFTRKSILTIHMRTHTGERPYACACGAAFTQPAALRAHRAARHPADTECE